jgi:hypothetical protein
MTDIVEQPVSTSHFRTDAGAGGRGAVREAPMKPKKEGGCRRASSAGESADTFIIVPKNSSQSEVGMSTSTSDVRGSLMTEIGQTVICCLAAIATDKETETGSLTEAETQAGSLTETETETAPLIAQPPWEGWPTVPRRTGGAQLFEDPYANR